MLLLAVFFKLLTGVTSPTEKARSLKFSKQDTLLMAIGFSNITLGSIYFTVKAKSKFSANGFPLRLKLNILSLRSQQYNYLANPIAL
jgi:hypothetical protein